MPTEYVELHCHSNFSLLDGAAWPEALVERAVELEMPALALTDHDAVYGAVRFAEAARSAGLRPIFGAELTLVGGHHLTLLVENETGWRNLGWLISRAQRNAPKGEAALPPDDLAGHTAGLIVLSGCRRGEIPTALLRKEPDAALTAARRYRELFGPDHFWLELQHHLRPEDGVLVEGLVGLARQAGLNYVATNNVHYPTRAGAQLQDVLVCIRHQISLDQASSLLQPNSEFYLKSARQLAPLFAAYPEALTNTLHIAERCRFELRYGLQELPQFLTPPGLTAAGYLQQLCNAALPQRYPEPASRVRAQLAYELAVIEQAGLANYFLIVWDIVRFAREQGIRGQGRGSAANSLVAYLLGISPIDPIAHDLVFERFLSSERAAMPDIDLDFQADRREEVIQYIYQRYGTDHAAMACTLVTFRARSALRDVGKVLGLPEALLASVRDQFLEPVAGQADGTDHLGLLRNLCHQLHGFPRHLGIHNGGMVITAAPLAERLPTEPATMAGRVVVQWDKDALETAGLVKIDLLGLRMLAAIAEAERLITALTGQSPRLDRLTFADPAVYEMIARADTLGVFQVESRAQAQILPRLKPGCFADLIITISLIRPGPIQGNMVHPYLRRRLGQEPVIYLHPRLEPALAETLGVILFQEQVLKVARDLAGFTPGQGELLRRALGSKYGDAEIARLRDTFIIGAQANGVPLAITETVFAQLQAFGGYSFAKSHAAAFAVLVYQSAWLKHYYPAVYLCAILNHQPLGFWSPAVLVGDARRRGLTVLPVDLQRSQAKCSLEGEAIRLGFNYVTGLGENGGTRLVTARQTGPFRDLADLCRRTRLPRRLVEQLILAGALDGWGAPRRQLLWALGQLTYQAEELPLDYPAEAIDLPSLSAFETLAWERQVLGLPNGTGEHVLTSYRPWLVEQGILGSQDLARQPEGAAVRVAGLVVVHQSPPTAKGFHFLTLEDEAGLIDVVIRPAIVTHSKKLPNRHDYGLNNLTPVLVEGIVQRTGTVVNILATKIQPLIPSIGPGISANSASSG